MSTEQTNAQTKKRTLSLSKNVKGSFKKIAKGKIFDNLFVCAFIVFTSFAVLFESYTPFIYPLMGYIIFNEKKYIKFLVLGAAGVAINGSIAGIARWVVVFAGLVFIASLKKRVYTQNSIALISAGLTGAVGVATCYFLNMGLIAMFTMAAETIICVCFYYIYSVFISMVQSRKSKTVFSSNDLICMGLSVSCMTAGFSRLYVLGMNFAFILSVFAILVLGKLFGSACAIAYAALSACLLAICAGVPASMISVFCISAITSALLSGLGTVVSAGVFCASMSFGTLMLAGASNVIVYFCACATAAAAYVGIFALLKNNFSTENRDGYESVVVNKETVALLRDEIDIQKKMLGELSENLGANDPVQRDGAVTYVCKVISGDICFSCDRYDRCWGEESTQTFEDFASVIKKAVNPNTSAELYFPKRLYTKCKNADLIPDLIPYIYDSYTARETYMSKLNAFKQLMCKRFDDMSGVLDRIYGKLSKGIYAYRAESKHALSAMQNFGMELSDVVVFLDFNNRLKAVVRANDFIGEKESLHAIPQILTKTFGKNFSLDKSCDRGELTYCYKQDYEYKLHVGIAGCSKHKGAESGDNTSNIILKNGIQMIALCDGMGSGADANRQSAKVLGMLEELMNAGCDETSSIETVNSVLVLCEAEEAFSTIDIFLFDLDKGVAEFVKAGACSSYIKNAEGISKVSFESMPVGILDYVNVRKGLKSVKSGDCVFMMSDGFFRAFGEADAYIKERLNAYEGRNPQRIAEGLLEEALCVTEGQTPDDITIIVIKIRQTKII